MKLLIMEYSLLRACALPALLALSAAECWAQTSAASSDEISVTALRSVNARDVTTSVFVMDEAELDIRDSSYLADQLRSVPGLGVSRSGAYGAVTQVRLRGAEANHTLVLLDGIEVSDPTSGETDFGLWSGLNVSRIEVARGEQSVLYGSEAIGGVIALQTGEPDGLRASGEFGSFETLRGNIAYGQSFDATDITLAASGFQTDGVDVSGLGGERDGSESLSLFAKAQIDISPLWELKLLASARRSEVGFDNDTDFDGRLNNVDNGNMADQEIFGASLAGVVGRIDHRLNASMNTLDLETRNDDTFANSVTGERQKISYSPSADIAVGSAQLTVSGLIDWERNDYERVDTNTFYGDPNQSQSFETAGIAGEARLRLGRAVINGSARYDDNKDRFDDAATWRVGAAYNFDIGARLRTSLGTGVKNPTFTELFGFTPADFVGNPDLKPEESQSWEVGFDQDLGDAQVSLTYFSAELNNEIFTDLSGFPYTARNRSGDSERSGVEAAGRWQINDAFNLSGSASQIRSENDSGVEELRVPQLTGSFAATWQSQDKEGPSLGLAVDYVGKQYDTDFGSFARVKLDPYWLVSASAKYPVTERVSFTLRGENLLDEEASDVFGYNSSGAGLFAGFQIR